MTVHKPVLLKETIELLNLKKGMTVVDATLGGGGHSREILERIGDSGTLIGFDVDRKAIDNFLAEFSIFNYQFSNNFQFPIYKYSASSANKQNIVLVNTNFGNLEEVLESLQIEKVDAIMADLGWSSDQVSDPQYGMSFMVAAELDMRLDKLQELTAKKIVNEYSEEDLRRIIREYGEENFAGKIAKKIVESRKNKSIETTIELAEIVKSAVPEKYKHGKINPATRTFQALRIEVNHELESLEKFLPQAIKALKPEGRLAIITFHSLEDRIVKNIFRQNAGGCICPPELPQCVCGKVPIVKLVAKKPIVPTSEETNINPRSRSAKLRVVEKI